MKGGHIMKPGALFLCASFSVDVVYHVNISLEHLPLQQAITIYKMLS